MHRLSKSFASSQGRVAYDTHGPERNGGTPIVLVHGTPSSSILWSKVWPRLAEEHTIILYDLPGYGTSERFEGQDVRLRTQAKVLAELIAHLRLPTPHLVGHDFGGATVMGAHLVEKVQPASLTVIDGVTLNPWGTPYSKLVRDNVAIFEALPDYVHEATVAAHLHSAVYHRHEDAMLHALLAPWIGADGKAAYYRQLVQYDHDFTGQLEALYPKTSAPTQILWGAEDAWLPPAMAPRLQSLTPGARLEWLPDAGHFAPLDVPNLIVEKIESFVGGR
jgi:pimeloyl-ACP methyl ester carboxylesterase